MNTLDFLQLWLSVYTRDRKEDLPTPKPSLILGSGLEISVQAGQLWWSVPKTNVGPYEFVEVLPEDWWDELFGVKEGKYPVAQVNIGQLAGLIDQHGGINVTKTLQNMADKYVKNYYEEKEEEEGK
jgi:hypothetical protein